MKECQNLNILIVFVTLHILQLPKLEKVILLLVPIYAHSTGKRVWKREGFTINKELLATVSMKLGYFKRKSNHNCPHWKCKLTLQET